MELMAVREVEEHGELHQELAVVVWPHLVKAIMEGTQLVHRLGMVVAVVPGQWDKIQPRVSEEMVEMDSRHQFLVLRLLTQEEVGEVVGRHLQVGLVEPEEVETVPRQRRGQRELQIRVVVVDLVWWVVPALSLFVI